MRRLRIAGSKAQLRGGLALTLQSPKISGQAKRRCEGKLPRSGFVQLVLCALVAL